MKEETIHELPFWFHLLKNYSSHSWNWKKNLARSTYCNCKKDFLHLSSTWFNFQLKCGFLWAFYKTPKNYLFMFMFFIDTLYRIMLSSFIFSGLQDLGRFLLNDFNIFNLNVQIFISNVLFETISKIASSGKYLPWCD